MRTRESLLRPAVLLVGGAVMLAAGAGLYLVGPSPGSAPHVVGGNLPIDLGATDPHQIAANNSPGLARNPKRPSELAVVNRVDSPKLSCALHVSSDGGGRWEPVDLPFPEGEEAPPRCFAPDASFDAGGTLYISFVTLKGAGNTPNALWLTSSSDGGHTLSVPRRVWGPLTFGPRLVADPSRAGHIDLVWLQVGETARLGFATTGNPVLMATSEDGGASWSGPYQVSAGSRARVLAPVPVAVARKGTSGGPRLYVAYLDLGSDELDYAGAHEGKGGEPFSGRWQLVVARSDDGGATWRESVAAPEIVPAARVVVLFPPTPSVAVDPSSGQLYVAMADARAGSPDVWLWSSADGISFAPPVRVNDTPVDDRTAQYLPALGVSSGGRLDVVYYDRRRDRANVMTEVSLQSSSDGGHSFKRSVRLSERSFDSSIGFGSERGLPDLGSRLALASSRERTLAMWADTRAGTVASGKQDVTQAVASFSGGTSGWRVAGAVLIAVGTVVLAGSFVLRLLQRR